MSEKQAVYAGEPKRHPITLTVGEPYEDELPGPPAPLERESESASESEEKPKEEE